MPNASWFIVGVGLLIAVIGLGYFFVPSLPWLGKLPGDIVIERENFRLYFPLATCILLSLLLTGIMWLVRYFSR
jgi:DUF2905 family protein